MDFFLELVFDTHDSHEAFDREQVSVEVGKLQAKTLSVRIPILVETSSRNAVQLLRLHRRSSCLFGHWKVPANVRAQLWGSFIVFINCAGTHGDGTAAIKRTPLAFA